MTRRLDLAILILAVGGGYFALSAPRPVSSPSGASPVVVAPATSGGTQAGAPKALGAPLGSANLPGMPGDHETPDRRSTPFLGPRTQHRPSATAAPTARRKPVAAPRVAQRPVTAPGHALRGTATFYGTGGPGSYGAMHEFADGSRVVVVVIAFHDGRTWSVTVPIVTQCGACRWQAGATLIDLSLAAWDQLGWPRSRGVIAVTVQIVEGALR